VRACGHPPSHNCHPDANGCPPCTTLCEKFCYGKHEKRKNIPCHLNEVSCGKACGRPMKCGKHTCPVTCHPGSCPSTCTQPCPVQRIDCDHSCSLPCHEGNCPGTPCREKVKVQCQVY
jgi:transcriptional repressor NF-X1